MVWDGIERRNVNWEDIISHMATTNSKLENIHATLVCLDGKVGKLNGRIGKLENWRSYILGAVGAVGCIFAGVITIINLVKK